MDRLILILLLPILSLCACEKDDVVTPPCAIDLFIVGNVGGWGGGYALKLEDHQLYISRDRAGVDLDPEALVSGGWDVYGDADDLSRIDSLRADLPTGRFLPENERSICQASIVDGTCPFVVLVDEDGKVGGWTAEPGITAAPQEDYMDRVARVVNEVVYE
ncbi:hypothetical protein GGR28_002747 [Lewinella aquimaris]|uniref:Uncharacterized protein n=1 Tax=Neolewinella aquimaris TaxID=1835722 RepID=A0A840E9T5_9BACT|nr:hypothetical protein [Neolewinella aquimaris]MBB4080117.1 hypothetical protein [Neolewinella aquimaris]